MSADLASSILCPACGGGVNSVNVRTYRKITEIEQVVRALASRLDRF